MQENLNKKIIYTLKMETTKLNKVTTEDTIKNTKIDYKNSVHLENILMSNSLYVWKPKEKIII